jgi:hypothetical protein
MMEAANTSETSVNFYQTTWPNVPEDSHLHTRRRQNLKSHQEMIFMEPKGQSPSPQKPIVGHCRKPLACSTHIHTFLYHHLIYASGLFP